MRLVFRTLCILTVAGSWAACCVVALPPVAALQEVDDSVRLKARSNLGVPLHPEPGNVKVTGRLPDGAVAKVLAIDAATGWLKVGTEDKTGWITKKYVDNVIPAGAEPNTGEIAYTVGCWNLEHFRDGATRGFPENTHGGPSYQSRSAEDYQALAAIVERLEVKILVLQEIFVEESEDGEGAYRSRELERLVELLGRDNYGYVVGESGNTQHVAILYDRRCVRVNAVTETDFRKQKVQKKNLFDRQPLLAHFTFLFDGKKMNDLTVVGVHLASGQQLTKNHDKAIKTLTDEFDKLRREEGSAIPDAERDIAVLGDFNANRFDQHEEAFWDDLESNGWDVLADEGEKYSATRLSGFPLKLREGQIDYIIVSKGNGGLAGEEVTQSQATVHKELIGSAPDEYRRSISDHLPVTIKVQVTKDND